MWNWLPLLHRLPLSTSFGWMFAWLIPVLIVSGGQNVLGADDQTARMN